MSALDPDALANLTDEERAAIEADDVEADEPSVAEAADAPSKAADADDHTVDRDNDDDAKGDKGDEGAGSDAAPVEASAPPAPAPAPRYEAQLPADYDSQVKALAERESELKRAFRAGELEFDEFETRRDELLREREGLTIARTKAEIAQEMNAQTAEQQWRSTVERFLDTSAAALDYRKDSEAMADLDGFVKMLAGREAHARQPMEWFLAEAHKRVLALRGAAPASPSTPAPAVDRKAEAAAARKPRMDTVPATLAQVPGADGPGDVGGEFADVLSLDGMEYETAIARMSPAQREKFARAT
jgi:hypothetical protein